MTLSAIANRAALAFAAAIALSHGASAVAPPFGRLRGVIEDLRSHATPEQLQLAEGRYNEHLVSCPANLKLSGSETHGFAAIKGAYYKYAVIDQGDDKYCLYMVEPFEQALNPDEARVLDIGESLSALQNYDLPTLPSMKPAAIEESLKNLLAAVRSGKYKLSENAMVVAPERYVDCSGDSDDVRHAFPSNTQSGYIYNSGYTWTTIQHGDGVCIYFPLLHRALNSVEAIDFERALHLIFVEPPLPLAAEGSGGG